MTEIENWIDGLIKGFLPATRPIKEPEPEFRCKYEKKLKMVKRYLLMQKNLAETMLERLEEE